MLDTHRAFIVCQNLPLKTFVVSALGSSIFSQPLLRQIYPPMGALRRRPHIIRMGPLLPASWRPAIPVRAGQNGL